MRLETQCWGKKRAFCRPASSQYNRIGLSAPNGDPFGQIAQLLGQPWWAIDDGNAQFALGRNRFRP